VFLFASLYHPSFRHAGPVRKDLGVPTAFNYLGPLTNPAQPATVAAGVADPVMGAVLAGTFAERGNTALVFHGSGLDELTTTGPSKVWVVAGGAVSETDFDPASIGLPRAGLDDLRGGDARHNAEVVRTLLAGERGPVRDIVLLNAAAAITASEGLPFAALSPGAASSDPASSGSAATGAAAPDAPAVADGLAKALADGIARAAQAIDSGAAAGLLQRWSAASHRLSTPRPR
jgi:anthranilate phosphoribosyltransferase